MEDEFANRLGMFRTVKQTLEQPENLAVWQGVQPLAFGVKFNNFTTGLAGLETFVTQHGQVITGSATDKRREKQELETAAHELGLALVCWFKSINDETNAEAVDRSISNWQRLRDEALLQQSQIVIDKAQAVVGGPDAAAAADYGVTPAAITALTNERNDYVEVIAAPQQKIAARKALTTQFRPEFNAVSAHLDDMDNLVLQYRKTPAGRAMVAAYQASRIIRDFGHGPGTGGGTGSGGGGGGGNGGGGTAPTAQEIDLLTQNGPNVEVGYASGGGVGATTITLFWQIDGTDPGFDNSIAATLPLQTVGPFSMGQTIRFKTNAENAAGSTESMVKQIMMT